MTLVVAIGAGAVIYLLALAATGYWCGEAPGALQRTLASLRGEQARQRQSWWTSEDGEISRQKRYAATLVAAAVLGGVGALVFRSLVVGAIFALAAPMYPYTLERAMRHKRRELLGVQFGMALQAMAASLRAGASLRSAVERATDDLERMLSGQPLKPMVVELKHVVRDLELGQSLEEALIRLRDRVNLEDVTDFVGAVLLCRVRGGNAAVVLANISEIIEDKIAVRQQILTLTAGKRMEGNMITFAPPVLVGIMGFTSPGYFAPLYQRPIGLVMLSVGVGCLVASYVISRRLLEIEI